MARISEELIAAGWTVANARVSNKHDITCSSCGADIYGLIVVRHPKLGYACKESCAKALSKETPNES